MTVESEVKLRFESADAARQAITAAGGVVDIPRRVLDDTLYDFPDGTLTSSGRALRVRLDGNTSYITVKGPPQAGPVKAREELETTVGNAETVDAQLRLLGYAPCFHLRKQREEFLLDGARVTVDETPAGVFVEIEAPADVIERVAARLGREPGDYVLRSYVEILQGSGTGD